MLKKKHIFHSLLLPVVFFSTGFCFGQNVAFSSIDSIIKNKDYGSALAKLDSIPFNTLSQNETGEYYYLRGKTLIAIDNHGESYKSLIKSRLIYLELDLPCKIKEVDLLIIELLSHQKLTSIDDKIYLDEFIVESGKCGQPIDKAIANAKIAVKFLDVDRALEAIHHFNMAIEIAYNLSDTLSASNFIFNKGVVYNTTLKQYDSALYFFKKVLPVYQQMNKTEFIAYNFNNQAEAYKKMANYPMAVMYYQKADSIPLKKYNLKTKIIFYRNMTDLYEKTNNVPKSYEYLRKLDSLKDNINETGQNVTIAEIKEQYDNEKLRADNLESEVKRTQNQNIAIALGGGLLGVSIIGFLLFKNTKRKQRIAEQEREIEIQKTEKLLKDQELTTIDAMISGQEKERQRLAGDLHDSVGATLAAAKLQFSHLQQHKSKLGEMDDLFEKTGGLLDQAYEEIRSMAHLKNSGVIAKNGLLPAIKKLAKNASGTNSLKVQVEDFGLDGRLENSLEIAIFRVIQELITNVIKHANASEAIIAITQHEDSLSIIVEDNGKGFDATKIETKEGMGLSSIERRIEHLEGTMEVDSTIGKGTSVLIDIPI